MANLRTAQTKIYFYLATIRAWLASAFGGDGLLSSLELIESRNPQNETQRDRNGIIIHPITSAAVAGGCRYSSDMRHPDTARHNNNAKWTMGIIIIRSSIVEICRHTRVNTWNKKKKGPVSIHTYPKYSLDSRISMYYMANYTTCCVSKRRTGNAISSLSPQNRTSETYQTANAP